MTAERILTAGIVVFGLLVLFFVMPFQVETVDYGRVKPSTLPSIVLVILIVAAVFQLISSEIAIEVNVLVCVRAAFFVALMIFGVWLMERFGFEYVAPVFALTVMLLIGERRWHWLLLGGVGLPLGVWLLVERVLDRMLA